VKLKAGDVYDVSTIFQKAYGSSRISKEENHRLQMMIRFDLLEKAGNGLRLTKKGYKFLHDAAEVDKIFEASGSAISEAPDIAIPIT
jgi:coproporphyrinogen III oxidase-like Fe-S oxidoreductase